MYYYLRGSDKIGPVSKEEILKLYHAGDINDETHIWTDGWSNWKKFGDLRVKKQATPPPVPEQPVKNIPLVSKSDSENYIIGSWRGEKSLAVSYWLNGILITLFLQVVLGIYNSASSLFSNIARQHVQLYFSIALVLEIFVVAVAVWQTVGILRSAENHKEKTNKKFFATLAQIIIVLTAIGSFAKIGGLKDYYNDVFWNALGKDPIGNYSLEIINENKKLIISGYMAFGLASNVDSILDKNSEIKSIVLNSDGGRIWEGENLYDVLKRREIKITTTETGCASACVIPFMAGEDRYINNEKRLLGFHSSSSPYYTSTSVEADNRRIKVFLTSLGISSDFTNKALNTPPAEMWYPTTELLFKEGIISRKSGMFDDILYEANISTVAPQVVAPVNAQQNIKMLENLVATDPRNRNAWVELGNAYFDAQMPAKSVEAYAKALELNPNDPNVLTDQGVMYRQLGMFDKAIENFIRANVVDPRHIQSLFNIGIVYRHDLQDYVKATEVWNRYLDINPTGETADRVREEIRQMASQPLIPAGQMRK